ncbi:MAG: hypothetical protein IJI01_07815 [Butyrivibrio sp.]|uniref:hypothetical protein n=1 Tax=Butyrivibrio sp. TaxID=28121 RepID=UPI0025B86F54|nr:hypothetical protein [Butyrivibrio sp.]MBQ6414965.1 hypothetical protein [Butyrivibrio sp.]MBQ6588567.1 hypothetical protein [Butyrivibrio sp.]
MSKNNRNKTHKNTAKAHKNSGFGKLMMSLVILGVVVLLFINYALPMLKSSFKKAAAEKTVEVLTENAVKVAGEDSQVTQILENLSEEDKEVVTEIVENHMDAESVSEVMGYVSDGDKDGLMKYAAENLSPEELAQLAELYGKYGN